MTAQASLLKTQIVSSDFDQFASDLAMSVWNRMTQFPQFKDLKPNDYPALFEVVEQTLQRYRVNPQQS